MTVFEICYKNFRECGNFPGKSRSPTFGFCNDTVSRLSTTFQGESACKTNSNFCTYKSESYFLCVV